MNPETKRLLDEAKAKKKRGARTAPICTHSSGLDSSSRKIIITNTCKRVIRTNKKAIELLADR